MNLANHHNAGSFRPQTWGHHIATLDILPLLHLKQGLGTISLVNILREGTDQKSRALGSVYRLNIGQCICNKAIH